MKKRKPKISEAELCSAFIVWAAEQGWVAYAETAGFDLVLVKDSVQIGVQAKLHFNATLLRQALPSGFFDVGPDYRAILLPEMTNEIRFVADFCGLIPFWMFGSNDFAPTINLEGHFYPWGHSKRLTLPEYVPDVSAGASAPVRLTRWKIAALRVAAVLQLQGHVTLADFKQFGTHPRLWVACSWLTYDRQGKRYVAAKPIPHTKQHPRVYAQIVAELQPRFGNDGTRSDP